MVQNLYCTLIKPKVLSLLLYGILSLTSTAAQTKSFDLVRALDHSTTVEDSIQAYLDAFKRSYHTKDSALYYWTIADAIAKQVQSIPLQLKVKEAEADFYCKTKPLDEAIEKVEAVIEFHRFNRVKVSNQLYVRLANLYLLTKKDIETYQTLKQIVDFDHMDLKFRLSAYNCYLALFSHLDELDSAAHYGQKGLIIARQLAIPGAIVAFESNLGMLKTKQQDFPAAIKHFKASISMGEQHNIESAIASYNALAELYVDELKDTLKALETIRIGLQESKIKVVKGYYHRGLTLMKLSLAKILIAQNQLDSAETLMQQTRNNIRQHNLAVLKKDLYDVLSRLYRRKGDPELAAFYTEQLIKTQDSILQKTRLSKKEIGIEFISQTTEQKEPQSDDLMTVFFMVGICTVLIAAVILYTNWQSTPNKSLKSAQTQQKNRVESVVGKPPLHTLILRAMTEDKVYINPNYKLDDLAQHLNVNRAYLSKTLNDHFKLNFNAFLAQYRIKEAQQLLQCKETKKLYTLEYIGHKSGFNSPTSFFRTFKQLTGQTPAEYRKENMGK